MGGDCEFYELAYGDPTYPYDRWEYSRAIEFLKGLNEFDPPRLLELGAGKGQFIKLLLKTIPSLEPKQVVATDYSHHSIGVLRLLGVDARLASVFDLASCTENGASFSAVCAFQSIEHMADVREIMGALRGMVRPGGLIILSVPNGRAIEFNEQHLRCFDMPPSHVGRWYRSSFEALATEEGLLLVAHEVEPTRLPQLLRDTTQLCVRGVAASQPQSLAGRAQAIENKAVRRALSALVGVAMPTARLPAIWRLDSGYAQLAVFRVPQSR